jgi:uncharacterized protein
MFKQRIAAALAAFLLLALPAAAETAGALRQGLVVATGSGEHAFQVELADDARERSRGLMYRRSMPKDEGMLFDFGKEQPVGFWMANTYIPLDMLFIKADGTVESIAERTTPMSQRSIPSKGPVRYVLEINGGLSRELGIRPGDKVSGPAMQPEG